MKNFPLYENKSSAFIILLKKQYYSYNDYFWIKENKSADLFDFLMNLAPKWLKIIVRFSLENVIFYHRIRIDYNFRAILPVSVLEHRINNLQIKWTHVSTIFSCNYNEH